MIRALGGPTGGLLAGTSGFAYPGWAPRFYPPTVLDADRLTYYAAHLGVVELNNTFYQRPSAERVTAWCSMVPDAFRFVVKAQRGATSRALTDSPEESATWLTERLDGFGDRLSAVLFRIPENIRRRDDGSSDARIRRFLEAWPQRYPLVVEFMHESWHVDETYDAMRDAGAILCTTELPESERPPDIRVTGSGLYLRLRRHDYSTAELESWVARLEPFLDAGHPVLAFFRHDETGRAAELATELADLAAR